MNEATQILPAALAAAYTVFKSLNGRLASRLGQNWPPGPGEEIIANIHKFFADNLVGLGDQSFGFKIDLSASGRNEKLTARVVRRELMKVNGTVLITIDSALNVIEIVEVPSETEVRTWQDFFQDASTSNVVIYFEQRNCAKVFASGGIVDEFVPATGEKAGKFGRFSHNSLNYRQAIQDHYEQCVKHATESDHWEDSNKRILRKKKGSAKKTEEIFQNSLLNWLRINLIDGTPWPEPRKPNKDRADIKIEVLGGRFYLIEIKWMGTSGGSTIRKLDRLSGGLKQLTQYLEEQPCPSHATLVAYDGRDEHEFDALISTHSPIGGMKSLSECEQVKVPIGGSCCVFFLYNKRASEL